MQDILQSLGYIINAVDKHVKNAHKPLTGNQVETIQKIKIEVITYLANIANSLDIHDYDDLADIPNLKRSVFDNIEKRYPCRWKVSPVKNMVLKIQTYF